jgi:HTH-type transcriptional regulator/antitoxin HigA
MTAIAVEPIRTKADLQAALLRVEDLMGAAHGSSAADELEILTDLIEAYERRHHKLPRASPVDVLRHLMEAHDLTQSDLPEAGSQAAISLVLTGRRQLTLRQIKALAVRFQVNPSVFI